MRPISELVADLHTRGGKVTPQRLLIYKLLQGNTTHPTAEALYAGVREVMPMVSLTTVYKTLNELVALGEVKRFDVDGTSHFDPNIHPHGEAVCLGCRRIVDVSFPVPLRDSIGDFHVTGTALTFYGYCRDCQDAGWGAGPNSDEDGARLPTDGEDHG